MKKIFLLFLAVTLLDSCSSIQKELRKGNYDDAFTKALRRVRNNEGKDKYGLLLEEAYAKAYARDMQQINFWKKTGNPVYLENIYNTLDGIRQRYILVSPVLPIHITSKNRDAVFQNINDNDLIDAKTKAAEYLYTHAMKLLETKNRFDARDAYNELLRTNELYPNFRDTNAQLQRAYEAGLSHVILQVANLSETVMPVGLEKELTTIDLIGLNSFWVKFDEKADTSVYYGYRVLVKLSRIEAGPEQVLKNKYTDSKKVEDGWEYVLDAKGNVMKDSLGNDIKTKKYKTISCDVIETVQKKESTIGAVVQFFTANNELIQSVPVSSVANFQYISATAIGDLNALSDASRAKLQHTLPAAFPMDTDLIMQAGENLKPFIKSAISSYVTLLR